MNDIQPVVKIFTKSFLAHFIFKPAIGGRQDAHIRMQSFGSADTLKFTAFDKAQKLGLNGKTHFTHLIEKKCSRLRQFKSSQFP